jgi:hypothetical protein
MTLSTAKIHVLKTANSYIKSNKTVLVKDAVLNVIYKSLSTKKFTIITNESDNNINVFICEKHTNKMIMIKVDNYNFAEVLMKERVNMINDIISC